MRALPLLLLATLAACTTTEVNAPSLAPRPAEAIDPRAPVPEPPIPTNPTPGLVDQLDKLVAEAVAGDAAFQPAIDKAERLAAAAGARESEGWVIARWAAIRSSTARRR